MDFERIKQILVDRNSKKSNFHLIFIVLIAAIFMLGYISYTSEHKDTSIYGYAVIGLLVIFFTLLLRYVRIFDSAKLECLKVERSSFLKEKIEVFLAKIYVVSNIIINLIAAIVILLAIRSAHKSGEIFSTIIVVISVVILMRLFLVILLRYKSSVLLFSDGIKTMFASESGDVFIAASNDELEVKSINKIKKIDLRILMLYSSGRWFFSSIIPYYSIYLENRVTGHSVILHIEEASFDEFLTYTRLGIAKDLLSAELDT
jgi:hypothetical protein